MAISKKTKKTLEVSVILILTFVILVALFYSAASVMHKRDGKIQPSFGLMLGIIVGIIADIIIWFTWGKKQIESA